MTRLHFLKTIATALVCGHLALRLGAERPVVEVMEPRRVTEYFPLTQDGVVIGQGEMTHEELSELWDEIQRQEPGWSRKI